MNTMYFKKASAVLCGAAIMLGVGATVSADNTKTAQIIGESKTVTLDDLKANNYEVTWDLSIVDNPGYVGIGLGISVPSDLTIVRDPDDETSAKFDGGDGAKGLVQIAVLGTKENKIAWTTAGSKNVTKDATIASFYFKVPETAKAGDKFPITLELSSFTDKDYKELPASAVNGYIMIEGGAEGYVPVLCVLCVLLQLAFYVFPLQQPFEHGPVSFLLLLCACVLQ